MEYRSSSWVGAEPMNELLSNVIRIAKSLYNVQTKNNTQISDLMWCKSDKRDLNTTFLHHHGTQSLISSIQTWFDVRFLCDLVERTLGSQNHEEVGVMNLAELERALCSPPTQEPLRFTNKENILTKCKVRTNVHRHVDKIRQGIHFNWRRSLWLAPRGHDIKVAFGLNNLCVLDFWIHLGNDGLDAAKPLIKQIVHMQMKETTCLGLIYGTFWPGHWFILWVADTQI